ncbi:FAD-binding oxidoreductase [Dichotomicrobium thermohalophilum]|uniref:4-phosphoerythronate dehydrogenase (FAD-dependent) n=1 Tax=Dichotomicrobium thermohalophilum TaxID=933063 RepID=A0A397Q7S8_9HYPH|nr:FAD-binding oxidoreductase [Dichotomicrobium thermohalophilum]RIA55875.1 4-phosphoerythronate dehydrogenase (FAD-dependent) [Dichotomicrobium thermohalophilum]
MLHRPGTTPPTPDILARLTEIVGAHHVITEQAELAPYMEEWRGLYHGRTPLLLKPGNTEEVAQILKIANESGIAVVPQGGNTGLVGGQIPMTAGHEIVLNLSRMNRVRTIDPANNTLTIEAGATLAQAQDAAAEVDRLFPLSLSAEGSCQIGGNLATNAGGIKVLAYGNARALTLGLEVVLADGRIWNGLRGLRKDNTGYDLRDLFIGSEGTLGIITAAVLRLFPRPAEQAAAFVALESLDDVARLFEMAQAQAGPALTAFEFIPRIAMEFFEKHMPEVRDPLETRHPWYVLMEVSGPRPDGSAERVLEGLLAQAFEAEIVTDGAVAASLAQAQAFWDLRERLSEVQKYEGGSVKCDVSVPLSKLPEFVRRANAEMERIMPGARPFPFGHFGDGNVHYNVSQPVGMDKDAYLARWDDIAGAAYGLAVELGGSISAEHGIGRMKRELLPSVKDDTEMWMMRTLKQVLDPNGILNPGKVI